MNEEKYLTVSALNRYIKYKFQYDDNLKNILLSGEISNFKRHSRGHFYFTLKDEYSQISAIMFKTSADKVLFEPKDGDKVYVKGSIQSYEQGGTYQIYVSEMKLSGIGDLYLKFEKLKKELEEAGLFNPEYKKPIPKYPNVIGVITSPTGAAIHDIITTTSRRYPLAKLVLYPALVQGENAKESIANQIRKANMDSICDVLIVGRGGGSLEDLWAFNEKIVAMAIFDSKIPIISAVGHEVDFSISDFVADKRAATPTAAAEIATPNVIDIRNNILEFIRLMSKNINNLLTDKKVKLINLDDRLEKASPIQRITDNKNNLNILDKRLNLAFNNIIEKNKKNIFNLYSKLNPNLELIIKDKLNHLNLLNSKLNPSIKSILDNKENRYKVSLSHLEAINPIKIMDRGFSVVSNKEKIVKKVSDVKKNDLISIRVNDGNISANVVEVYKNGE